MLRLQAQAPIPYMDFSCRLSMVMMKKNELSSNADMGNIKCSYGVIWTSSGPPRSSCVYLIAVLNVASQVSQMMANAFTMSRITADGFFFILEV